MSRKKDQEEMKVLLHDFFQQPHVVKRMNFIAEKGLKGWENWWQIEFLQFLSDRPEISEVEKEYSFFSDMRRSEKEKAHVDLLFRQKGHKKYTVVELKRKNSTKNCCNKLIKDMEKVDRLKPNEKEIIRRVFAIGIHPYDSDAQNLLPLLGIEYVRRHCSFKLKDSGLACTLIWS